MNKAENKGYESKNKGVYEGKKFIRYKEGAEIYSMSLRSFQNLAKDAHAIYKVGGIVLVNCEVFENYLETFRLED